MAHNAIGEPPHAGQLLSCSSLFSVPFIVVRRTGGSWISSDGQIGAFLDYKDLCRPFCPLLIGASSCAVAVMRDLTLSYLPLQRELGDLRSESSETESEVDYGMASEMDV